jgi:hypothetical protein
MLCLPLRQVFGSSEGRTDPRALTTLASPARGAGMIEAIAHLIHRDYDAIVNDFVTLQFIPEGTDLKPILPVLAKV